MADRFEAAAAPYVHAKLVASHTTEGDKKETLLQWLERQPPPLMIERDRLGRAAGVGQTIVPLLIGQTIPVRISDLLVRDDLSQYCGVMLTEEC
jgi:hypothetical protein